MDRTTTLRIVDLRDDGTTSDLAVGTIDTQGMIALDQVTEGQEPRAGVLVEDLNGLTQVNVISGSRDPDAPPGALAQRAVRRGDPGFHDALAERARRYYRVDLQFSRAVLDGALPRPEGTAKLMIDPEVEANLAVNLTPPRGPGVFDD